MAFSEGRMNPEDAGGAPEGAEALRELDYEEIGRAHV